ncbi:MAG: CHAD domain-containing protein [Coriobacteriia bacterium]|nr:CHAD domain-containing protein [Coriobacteriia bacterium]
MNKRFIIPGVSARTPLAEAAPALLLAKAEPLFALEEAARSGADADAVHDMRVASRRLREAMRLLEPLYPRREFRAWYRRVRRITRALGPVRDSDVFIEDFAKLGSRVGGEGKRAVAFMIGYRFGRREHELAALNAELGHLDLEGGRRSLEALAFHLADPRRASVPFAAFAYGAIAERAATVFGAQPAALSEASVTQQHELRIHYKRLRYAAEAFAPCYDDAFDAVHATLTAFQDTLGDMHDMHVFLELLRSPEIAQDARQAGVPAGALVELESVIEAQAHAGFERFAALAAEHPGETLLPRLLLPLTRAPEPEQAVVAAEEADGWEEAGVVSPVIVGDEPWSEGWDEGESVVEPLPIVEPGGEPGA